MKATTFKPIAVFIIIAFLAGCSTVNTLDTTREKRPHRKKSSMFNYPYDEVFSAAESACKKLGLQVYYRDEGKGKIYARSLVRWLSVIFVGYGEKVAIYIIPVEEDYIETEVVVQKVYLLSVGYVDWRDKILKEMDKILEKPSS